MSEWRFGMRIGDDGEPFVWISAEGSGAWARVYAERVEQGGPRRLWNEMQTAHRWWTEQGRPGPDRFGLTATATGEQRLWLDGPENPVGTGTGAG